MIIPTYNEVENMGVIIPRLVKILGKERIPFEIIVMDDNSPDGTARKVRKLSKKYPQAHAVVRKENRGLSPSVIDGYAEASGDVLLVMDADMSHPPEVVPEMYRAIVDRGADISVGSRHAKEGGIENWPLSRKIISWGAALLSRPLTSCSDPMSGFFAVRPGVIRNAPLKAQGYKILLEVLVKGNYEKVEEVPIVFRDREYGESKLGSGVIMNYIGHLIQLYLFPGSAPLIKFLIVGGSGMLVDLGLVTLLLLLLGDNRFDMFSFEDIRFFHLYQGVSFFYAVTWNFVWNRYWTFDAKKGSSSEQFVKFFTIAIIALAIRSVMLYVAVEELGFQGMPLYHIALVSVIAFVTIINFLGSKLWAFRKK